MINDIKEIKLKEHLNLYMVNSRKFKTDLLGVFIKRPLNKNEAAKNALLTRVLLRSTNKHRTSQELSIVLEDAYGMILVSDVVKYGETHVLQFKLQFPNEKHINEKNLFENALNLLKEVIFEPHIQKGKFNEEYFLQEQSNLVDEIHSRVNDKMSWSLERCLETMYEGDPYSIYQYGEVEDVLDISNEDLFEHYKNIIDTSMFDVCVSGNVDFDKTQDLIEKSFDISDTPLTHYPEIVNNKGKKEVKEIKEKFQIEQGKLVLGYRTNIDYRDKLYEASVLANYILGGGANSKLFMNIREKESLCYYIFAKADKFKGCMLIGAGIEFDKYDKVVELVNKEIEKVKSGDFTDEDLDIAKQAMVSSIKSLSDFPNSFINFYYTEVLGRSESLEQVSLKNKIEKYSNVTREEVIKTIKLLELDTIYFLEGEGDDSECN